MNHSAYQQEKAHKFAVSILFSFLAKVIFPSFSSKFKRIFTDAYYSDCKIRDLGFDTKLSLVNLNEKLF